ncbi:unnamed protein product [Haemonchus placei]|uniref:Uncharacterized protein n=1 Tax=Haemonchus placei TaxID=6290 RepID=A0A3P7U3A1_HAEPC|nr:unnamed protein product [Haemonchus placei]
MILAGDVLPSQFTSTHMSSCWTWLRYIFEFFSFFISNRWCFGGYDPPLCSSWCRSFPWATGSVGFWLLLPPSI